MLLKDAVNADGIAIKQFKFRTSFDTIGEGL